MGYPVRLVAGVVLFAAVVGPATAAGGGVAAGTAAECSFPHTATDATGTEVTVDAEPGRIVTLAPSAAQTMWEIGGEGKVVGVTKYATYLDGAGTRTNVSGSGQAFVSVEAVIDLEPDLVLAPDVIANGTVEKLREAGLTVYKFREPQSIDDIGTKTLRTGRLAGECEGAAETVAWMDGELATVREAVEGQDRPRVLYVFFGYTGGTGTFAHAVIEAAGGDNVAANANISGYKPINQETVVASNPEWIVVNDGATQLPKNDAYNSTDAVRNDRVVVLREEYISQPAPRIVLSVVKLARAFHPEAYGDANATDAATAGPTTTPSTGTATPGATPTGTATATPAPTSTPTPGFGAVTAVLALVVSLALARRIG